MYYQEVKPSQCQLQISTGISCLFTSETRVLTKNFIHVCKCQPLVENLPSKIEWKLPIQGCQFLPIGMSFIFFYMPKLRSSLPTSLHNIKQLVVFYPQARRIKYQFVQKILLLQRVASQNRIFNEKKAIFMKDDLYYCYLMLCYDSNYYKEKGYKTLPIAT